MAPLYRLALDSEGVQVRLTDEPMPTMLEVEASTTTEFKSEGTVYVSARKRLKISQFHSKILLILFDILKNIMHMLHNKST